MLNNNLYLEDSKMGENNIIVRDDSEPSSTPKGFAAYTNGLDTDSSYNSLNDSVGTFDNSEISGNNEFKEYILNTNNPDIHNTVNKFYIKSELTKESIFEFIGMYVYITIGSGVYSQIIINNFNNEIDINYWFILSIGWGLGLLFGTYISLLGNSDGYLNPALLLSAYMLGDISNRKLYAYTIIYFVSAFLGAFTIYVLNIINIERIGYNKLTANIFSTYKVDTISITTGFFTEVYIMSIFTFIFLNIKNTIEDKKKIFKQCKIICLLFIGLSLSLGYGSQMAINPARDFAPRLFTLISPWYGNVFTYSSYWFWVPIVAPYIGSLIGAFIFYILIRCQ